ncbi:NUDIX hydrolase [Lederbergia galactosidilytica]|uniref:DNA mismatch repair protein MutT n=1 Tax=Lederbergia galactosidilytica TaxID=217031 RepID=A0A178A5S8_9BACI|nr:8-oxo-dGTP diphosphatase [Lederbergia galactosidilytica]MBP1915086.1 8-oxo-dGTP diphosphatase [Lederbergia galactosidilytica]OAK75547.1 DNA mismatch repair protein MutT [Lederbergia galactosidilytica]
MLKYTLCFIRKGSKLLLLNRTKSPNMGLWNGVGGKIEENETPIEGILREAWEETGIALDTVIHAGNVTWKSDQANSGMYLFLADLPEGVETQTPLSTREGILEWKEIDWILHPDNKGIVDNIPIYLAKILNGQIDLEYKFTYKEDIMVRYEIVKLDNQKDLVKI